MAEAAPSQPAFWPEVAAGFRRNLIPGLCLQAIALAVVAAYFGWPAAQAAMDRLAQAKAAGGLPAAAVVTAICGGLLPWLVMLLRGEIPAGRRAVDLLFFLGCWAVMGMEVDLFYRLQAWAWGGTASLGVVAVKVACDQFGFTPFWSLPQTHLAFRWRACGYDHSSWGRELSLRSTVREVAVLTTSAWVVWIPGTAIIFSMPVAMQFPLFSLVLVFWSLVVTALGSRAGRPPADSGPASKDLPPGR